MIFGNYDPRDRFGAGRQSEPAPTQERRAAVVRPPKPPFETLDSVLAVLRVLAIIIGLIAVVVALADDSPVSFAVAGAMFGSAVTCAIGQVLIFIAQRVDRLAELRELAK